MKKVNTAKGYDFYIGYDDKEESKPFYNIVPSGSQPPNGGYGSPEYIAHIKKVSPLLFLLS